MQRWLQFQALQQLQHLVTYEGQRRKIFLSFQAVFNIQGNFHSYFTVPGMLKCTEYTSGPPTRNWGEFQL